MAVRTHYVPQRTGNFDTWVNHFVEQLADHPAEYEVNQQRIDDLNAALAVWNTKYAHYTTARDQAKAATLEKDEAYATLDELVRDTARRIQANSDVSDAARAEAGLPIHKTTRTPVPVPTTSPMGQVIASDRLEHTLSFADSVTPTRRARPNGVKACEVYVFVGETAPVDPNDYRFDSLATRTPHLVDFQADDGNKTAFYLLRWVNTKGEIGPWSQIISATVPAV